MERRPDPEAFLAQAQAEERGRGKLKIFLGYAAGVGKTFAMLEAAHQRKREGVDLVVGYIETHKRQETESMLSGLEVLPRASIDYRGIKLTEMDVDAILARHPQLVLVDEMAHTNAPGSRHAKRYQDIEEILDAGIDIYTTLNIQHLESLHEMVERATGVRVKERIPDYVVAMADQIVNVDLSAEDLLERLKAGKIYALDRVQTAMENFFKAEKLTQLRELAMEEIAFRLDRHRQKEEQRSGENTSASERVMVCLSSRSPNADAMLRKASRIALRLSAPWYAVYIQTPREALEQIDSATQRLISTNLELAGQLGGASMVFKGTDLVSTIASFAKEYGITHIILGRTRRPWHRRWFGQSVLERLLQTIPGVDVIVVDNVPISR